MDWNDVVPHLTGLAHLATADGDGAPAVAIVSPLIDDGVLWVSAFTSSRKVRNVAANGRVALMWESGSEVYLWGTATVVDDVTIKERLWTQWHYDASAFFGEAGNPGVALVRIVPERASLMVAGDAGPRRATWRA
jgi:general stress protein 26